MSSSYHCNKKDLSKQILPMTYTLEKMVSAAATFKGFVARFFSDKVKKRVALLWPV